MVRLHLHTICNSLFHYSQFSYYNLLYLSIPLFHCPTILYFIIRNMRISWYVYNNTSRFAKNPSIIGVWFQSFFFTDYDKLTAAKRLCFENKCVITPLYTPSETCNDLYIDRPSLNLKISLCAATKCIVTIEISLSFAVSEFRAYLKRGISKTVTENA